MRRTAIKAAIAVLCLTLGCQPVEPNPPAPVGDEPDHPPPAPLGQTTERPPPLESGVSGAFEDNGITYLKDAKAILDAKCANCHGVPAAGGSPATFRLDRYETADLPGAFSKAASVAARVEAGTMPQAGSPALTDAEKRTLLDWVRGGAKQGTETEPPNPSVTLVMPSAARETPQSGTYAVQVTLANYPEGATYDLYRTTTNGTVTGGTLVATGLSDATYIWSTQGLPAGEQFFYVIAHAPGLADASAASAGSVLVSDNVSPSVALTGVWNGDGAVLAAANARVTFSATDPQGQALAVAIELSADGGINWSALPCLNASSSGCDLDLTGRGEGSAQRIRVTVKDPDDFSGIAASASSFGIAAKTYTYLGEIEPMLDASGSCKPCHSSGGSSAGSFRWDSYGGTVGAFMLKDRARIRTQEGTMPQVGSGITMSAANKTMLALWAWQGGAEGTNQPPTATLAALWNGGQTVTGTNTGTITYTVSDPDGDPVTVSKVEFSSNSGATWTQIACTPTTTQCAWNATPANGSTYRIRLTLADDRSGSAVVASASNFTLSVGAPNSPPTAALTGFWDQGGDDRTAADTGSITYTTSDPDGDPLTVTVKYSADSGATWTTVTCANGANNPTTCSWNAPVPATIPEGDGYRVRVIVNDGVNADVSDTTLNDAGLTITAYTYTGQIRAALLTYCSSCHGVGDGRFQPDMYTNGGLGAFDKRNSSVQRIYGNGNGPMPPGGGWSTTAQKADRTKIRLWIWQGAVN